MHTRRRTLCFGGVALIVGVVVLLTVTRQQKKQAKPEYVQLPPEAHIRHKHRPANWKYDIRERSTRGEEERITPHPQYQPRPFKPRKVQPERKKIYAMDESVDCGKWLACESTCVRISDQPIPKHVHIISLGHPFTFIEWLSVISAKRWIRPDRITVYTDGKQDSCWWRRALPYVQHQLVYMLPGSRILNGEAVTKLAHVADFLRLLILYHNGGIYIDTDAITVQSFDGLLSNQVVLAEQCHNLTNIGVILAQKQNCFICRFAQHSCRQFSGRWIDHSVAALTALLRDTDKEEEGIKVLPLREGFFPGCFDKQGHAELFQAALDSMPQYNISKIFTVHLYETRSRSIIEETMYNASWIRTNRSMVATVLHNALPVGFSQAHYDTEKCLNLSTVL